MPAVMPGVAVDVVDIVAVVADTSDTSDVAVVSAGVYVGGCATVSVVTVVVSLPC